MEIKHLAAAENRSVAQQNLFLIKTVICPGERACRQRWTIDASRTEWVSQPLVGAGFMPARIGDRSLKITQIG